MLLPHVLHIIYPQKTRVGQQMLSRLRKLVLGKSLPRSEPELKQPNWNEKYKGYLKQAIKEVNSNQWNRALVLLKICEDLENKLNIFSIERSSYHALALSKLKNPAFLSHFKAALRGIDPKTFSPKENPLHRVITNIFDEWFTIIQKNIEAKLIELGMKSKIISEDLSFDEIMQRMREEESPLVNAYYVSLAIHKEPMNNRLYYTRYEFLILAGYPELSHKFDMTALLWLCPSVIEVRETINRMLPLQNIVLVIHFLTESADWFEYIHQEREDVVEMNRLLAITLRKSLEAAMNHWPDQRLYFEKLAQQLEMDLHSKKLFLDQKAELSRADNKGLNYKLRQEAFAKARAAQYKEACILLVHSNQATGGTIELGDLTSDECFLTALVLIKTDQEMGSISQAINMGIRRPPIKTVLSDEQVFDILDFMTKYIQKEVREKCTWNKGKKKNYKENLVCAERYERRRDFLSAAGFYLDIANSRQSFERSMDAYANIFYNLLRSDQLTIPMILSFRVFVWLARSQGMVESLIRSLEKKLSHDDPYRYHVLMQVYRALISFSYSDRDEPSVMKFAESALVLRESAMRCLEDEKNKDIVAAYKASNAIHIENERKIASQSPKSKMPEELTDPFSPTCLSALKGILGELKKSDSMPEVTPSTKPTRVMTVDQSHVTLEATSLETIMGEPIDEGVDVKVAENTSVPPKPKRHKNLLVKSHSSYGTRASKHRTREKKDSSQSPKRYHPKLDMDLAVKYILSNPKLSKEANSKPPVPLKLSDDPNTDATIKDLFLAEKAKKQIEATQRIRDQEEAKKIRDQKERVELGEQLKKERDEVIAKKKAREAQIAQRVEAGRQLILKLEGQIKQLALDAELKKQQEAEERKKLEEQEKIKMTLARKAEEERINQLAEENKRKAQEALLREQERQRQLAKAAELARKRADEEKEKLRLLEIELKQDLITLTTIYNQICSGKLVRVAEKPLPTKIPVPPDLLPLAKLLYELGKRGVEVLLVGGVIRDLLKGKHPNDVDLVTGVSPETLSAALVGISIPPQTYTLSLIEKLNALEKQKNSGKSFSSIVGFQKGRWVVFHNPEILTLGKVADAIRRDCTQNTLHGKIVMEGNQVWIEVYDSLNMGCRHIQRNILQVVSHLRLRIDPIYLLRIITFMARFKEDQTTTENVYTYHYYKKHIQKIFMNDPDFFKLISQGREERLLVGWFVPLIGKVVNQEQLDTFISAKIISSEHRVKMIAVFCDIGLQSYYLPPLLKQQLVPQQSALPRLGLLAEPARAVSHTAAPTTAFAANVEPFKMGSASLTKCAYNN